MKLLRSLIVATTIAAFPANAATIAITQGSGTNMGGSLDGSGSFLYGSVLCGNATVGTLYGTVANCAVVNSSGQLSTLTALPGTSAPVAVGTATTGTAGNINAYLPGITGQTLTTVQPAVSAFGAPGPASGAAMGANGPGPFDPIIQTHATLPINISTAVTTQLVALVASQKIYVTSWDVMAPSGNFTLEYGTGTLCATGTTALTGPEAMAGGQVGKGTGLGPVLIIPASNALCAVTSAAVQYSGSLSYVQF